MPSRIRCDGPGFITASSYLRGSAFAGMRELMRRTFDELWIINLEGDNLGARKTENVFAIQTPVAIAIGLRSGPQQKDVPAKVRYTRVTGSQKEKLATLDAVASFADLPWRECFTGWQEPFLPTSDTAYWSWPLLTNLFPWQANGAKIGRTWPIAGDKATLVKRWNALVSSTAVERRAFFKDSPTGRKAADPAPKSLPAPASAQSIALSDSNSPIPSVMRYSFRTLDRQWLFADGRLIDRPSPELWRAHSERQVYLTSLLTEVLGEGPAAVATGLIPDLHHFRGSFGGAHVIPLWRDQAGTTPNLTAGLLGALEDIYKAPVPPERLFAYAYGVLASPHYVELFWDELTIPGPRLPITKDRALFDEVADLGAYLIWLHTYGERYVPDGWSLRSLPYGAARIEEGVPQNEADYPEEYVYDPVKRELRVGKGRFANVAPEVWSFSVSGFHVVDSWLGYRMRKRAGKSSSPLDELRPERWEFDDELLDLLWVLEHTLAKLPEAATLLDRVLEGELFKAGELPMPTEAERHGPKPKGEAANIMLEGFEEPEQ